MLACSKFPFLYFLLQANTTVTKLDLKYNSIEEDGTMAVCSMMEENCYITNLNLSHNNMSYTGSMAVEKMLQSNSTLTELNCSGKPATMRALHWSRYKSVW